MRTLTVEPSIFLFFYLRYASEMRTLSLEQKNSLSCKLDTAPQEQDLSAAHFVEALKYLRIKNYEKKIL